MWLNLYGPSGSGKTHLSKILEKKINKLKILNEKHINNNAVQEIKDFECLIIDNFENRIDEKIDLFNFKSI